jgi:hypothetical protein
MKRVLNRPSSPSATRQQRYRRRQRAGEIMVTVGLLPAEIDKLHRLGCVELGDLEDRAALAHALHLLIEAIKEA